MFNLEPMALKSNYNLIKKSSQRFQRLFIFILHKLKRTGFFGNDYSVIRYKPSNGSNKRSMNYLIPQTIIIFNKLGLIYLASNEYI